MDPHPVKIVVYHCHNLKFFSNGNQKDFARARPGLKMTSVPCSGKVEAHHLLSTLAADADGVLVVGCAKSACKYIEGSKRSTKRADYAKLWLKNLGIETDRIRFVHLPPTDTNALDGLLKEFASTLASFAGVSPIATQKAE